MKQINIFLLILLPYTFLAGQVKEKGRFESASDTLYVEQLDERNKIQPYWKTTPLAKHPGAYAQSPLPTNYPDSMKTLISTSSNMPVHIPDLSKVIPIPLAEIDTSIHYTIRIKEVDCNTK